MFKLENCLVIVSSIGTLLLTKTMIAMIVPIIAHYEWAGDYQKHGDQIPTVDSLYGERSSLPTWIHNYTSHQTTSAPANAQASENASAEMSSGNLTLLHRQGFGNDSYLMDSSAAVQEEEELDSQHPIVISNKLIALFMSYPLIALLLSPISGILGDRVGFDVPLLLAFVATTVICLLYAFTDSFLSILSARLLQGVASGFGRPNAFARMFVIYPQSTDKGKYVLALAMGANAFDFLGPAIVGFIFDQFGPIVCFLSILPYVAALAICVCLTSLSSCRRNPDLERYPINQRYTSSPNSSEETSSGLTDTVKRLWDISTHSKIIIATLTISVVWLPRTSLEPTIAFWLKEHFSSGVTETGLVWGVGGASVLLSNLIAARVSVLFPQKMWLYTAISASLCCVPIILLPLAPNVYLVAVCFALYIVNAASARFGGMFLLTNIAQSQFEDSYGLIMSFASIGFLLPYFITPFVSIPLYNHIGFESMCFIIGPISLIYSPLLVYTFATD